MRRLFNLKTGRTLILDLMNEHSVNEVITESRGGMADGADGIALEISNLDPAERNADSFKRLMDTVPLPFMFIHYRKDSRIPVQDDEARQANLLTAAEAGAGMIDVMGDLYNPSPDERARDVKAIEKQKLLIDRIHSLGSQVVMSSHPLRFMKAEEIVEQLKDFESRGADVVKIVTTANTMEEFAENTKATMLAWKELKTPFIHLCGGSFARIQRFNGLSLGCAITFGVHEYHPEMTYNQPLIREFRSVQNSVLWNINNMVEK